MVFMERGLLFYPGIPYASHRGRKTSGLKKFSYIWGAFGSGLPICLWFKQSLYFNVNTQKVALITGAAGHLGQAASSRFLAAGYRVIATVSPGKRPMRVEGVPRQPEWSPADLSDERSARTLVNTVLAKYEHIDAALFLAGGFAMGKLAHTNKKALMEMIALNFETAYYTARLVFEHMCRQARGGSLIFIGARPALQPQAGKEMVAYSLSKSLLLQLAEIMNAQGEPKGVTASVIIPSIIDTPDNRKAMPHARFDDWVKPEEIAEMMEILCSDKAKSLRQTVLKMYGNA